MTGQKPTSLKLLIAVITSTAFIFLTSILLSNYQVDKKYFLILVGFMFVPLVLTAVGIYTGLKYKTEDKKGEKLNRIGLIGNLIIFILSIGLMVITTLINDC